MKKIFCFLFIVLSIPLNSLAISNYTWSTLDLSSETSSNLNSNNTDNTSNYLNFDCRFMYIVRTTYGASFVFL